MGSPSPKMKELSFAIESMRINLLVQIAKKEDSLKDHKVVALSIASVIIAAANSVYSGSDTSKSSENESVTPVRVTQTDKNRFMVYSQKILSYSHNIKTHTHNGEQKPWMQ